MEDRSYRRNRALATPLAHVRGFPANEIECALISMMARSIVKRSTDRSDTLVQDPTSPAERLSPCNTPPVHTRGSVFLPRFFGSKPGSIPAMISKPAIGVFEPFR